MILSLTALILSANYSSEGVSSIPFLLFAVLETIIIVALILQ